MAILTGTRRDKALAEYLTKCLDTPFQWGVQDCCLFVGRWLDILTGYGYVPKEVTWNDAKSAARYIKKTYKSLENGLESNFVKLPSEFASDGDITIYQGSLFIFSGGHIVSVGEGGLVHLPRSLAPCAYCVLERG
jgi:hypothetical protein